MEAIINFIKQLVALFSSAKQAPAPVQETPATPQQPKNEKAMAIAVKLIKQFEGCYLTAYPDPGSPLYAALSKEGMLKKYMAGTIKWDNLPANLQALSGAPYTCGWGNTKGVTKDTVYTQAEADEKLEVHVREFMEGVLKAAPNLAGMSPSRIAACTSLAYNIGVGAFKSSTVAKKIALWDVQGAAQAFLLWNKAGGKVMAGLVKRRKIESDLFLSED